MAAMVSILGIGSVKAKHNCCFCKVHVNDYKRQNDEAMRSIEELIEDAASSIFSVKYIPLLKNVPLVDYKICSLHLTLRIGEAQLKETLNFVNQDAERSIAMQTELRSLKINWDMSKITKGSATQAAHYKKISLNKEDVYRLCKESAFKRLLSTIDESHPNIDLLLSTWEHLSSFVRLVNKSGILKESEVNTICSSIDGYLTAANQLFLRITPYMHFLSHVKVQVTKDKCFGFFSTQIRSIPQRTR